MHWFLLLGCQSGTCALFVTSASGAVLCCRVVEWVRQSGFAVDTAMVNTAMESVRLCGESLLCVSLALCWLA